MIPLHKVDFFDLDKTVFSTYQGKESYFDI